MGRRVFGAQPTVNPDEIDVAYTDTDKQPGKRRSKLLTYCLGTVISACAVTGAVFGVMALRSHQENVAVTKDWDDIRSIAAQGNFDGLVADPDRDDIERDDHADKVGMTFSEGYEFDPMAREINWNALWEVNKQIYCWIYIPGTEIDYPVIKEKTAGQYYYLDHDVHGTPKQSGCIVTDIYGDTSAHYTILGHNMKNSSMFGTLRYYRDQEFYNKSPYVYMYYPDRIEKWEVWSVFHTTEGDIVYDTPYDYRTSEYEKLLKHIRDNKKYSTAIDDVKPDTQVMTLSTCEDTDGTKRGRFVVNLIKDTVNKKEGA